MMMMIYFVVLVIFRDMNAREMVLGLSPTQKLVYKSSLSESSITISLSNNMGLITKRKSSLWLFIRSDDSFVKNKKLSLF